jgi:hypothetical protein
MMSPLINGSRNNKNWYLSHILILCNTSIYVILFYDV